MLLYLLKSCYFCLSGTDECVFVHDILLPPTKFVFVSQHDYSESYGYIFATLLGSNKKCLITSWEDLISHPGIVYSFINIAK